MDEKTKLANQDNQSSMNQPNQEEVVLKTTWAELAKSANEWSGLVKLEKDTDDLPY